MSANYAIYSDSLDKIPLCETCERVSVLFGIPPLVTWISQGRGDFRWKGNKLPRVPKLTVILFKELDVYREAIKRYHDTNTRNYPEDFEEFSERTDDCGNAVRTPHLQIG